MLRNTFCQLGRPKGPLGLRPGKEYRLTVPYRSEVTMIRFCNNRRFNSNIRELFKKPLMQNNLKAIPRDLGDLPRNYVLKLLYFHQPIRLVDFWEVCKQHDDVPLDSAKHLRLVLKIAKLQKWVYAEKNQTNNLYYYYIHQSRMHEVKDMVHSDEVVRKRKEEEEAEVTLRQSQEDQKEAARLLDDNILTMQNILAQGINAIRDFDPGYVEDKPYVMENEAINFTWHWEGLTRCISVDNDLKTT
ncbi:unnamed protein product [Phytomonas sp. Hart1]|nr:unnamed protein product [Phytomonas sp. Hart1]|eukprot:CCW67192.1 unnamed protein product [Phytomonas sp. isolate Hart1]